MRRFIMMNRWWAFILTLVLSVAGVAAMPAVGLADGSGNQVGEGINPSGGVDPTGAGDPDVPINSGKTGARPCGRIGRVGVDYGADRLGAGDATAAQTVWLFKYRIALKVFRVYVLRF